MRRRAQSARQRPLPPVLTLEARHAVELATIAGDDNQRAAACVAGNQNVVPSDGATLALEGRPDISGMMRRRSVKRQHLEPSGEVLDLPAVGVLTR